MAVNYKELKSGGFIRQKQPDFFSMRVKCVAGNLTVEQLAAIKKVAEKFGRQYIHLTSRQGVEIPFIHLNDLEQVKKFLAANGLQTAVCGAGVRTITACQGSAVCPSGWIDCAKIAGEIDERYSAYKLPHKFKIGITGCRNNCLKAEQNDIGIKGGAEPAWSAETCTYCGRCQAVCPAKIIAVDKNNRTVTRDAEKCVYCGKCVRNCPTGAWAGTSGFVVSFGGLYGNRIAVGEKVLPIILDEAELFKVIDAALDFFARNWKAGERFRFTLERVGWEIFASEVRALTTG